MEKSNIKLYNKLKAVKSSLNNLEVVKEKELKRRERFSETLHYQGQVYKTFTDFLRSDHNPRMFLRSEKDKDKEEGKKRKSRGKSPTYKVEVIEVCEDGEKETKHRSKRKRRSRKIKVKSGEGRDESVGVGEGETVSSQL